MACQPTNCLDAPTFQFNSPNQSEDWKAFYTRALDYLDALDIETDEADDFSKGWKQLKLTFGRDDREALQIGMNNCTITGESVKIPQFALDPIGTMKSKEHF